MPLHLDTALRFGIAYPAQWEARDASDTLLRRLTALGGDERDIILAMQRHQE